MATLNNGTSFIFAGESSEEHGVFIASSLGSVTFTSGDENRSLITSTSPFKEIIDLHHVENNSPLEFEFIIVKSDGTYIDANDERRLKKWLLKSKREWLQIDQDDLSEILYYIVITTAEKINVSSYNGGLKLHCIADCSHAWSKLYKKSYTTVSDTLNTKLNFSFDYDEYVLYPQLKIKSLSSTAQTIKIKNVATNEELTIQNCIQNEEISIDCGADMLKSSTNRNLISSWNKNMISFKEGINQIILTGNYSLEVSYRLPIRIGG